MLANSAAESVWTAGILAISFARGFMAGLESRDGQTGNGLTAAAGEAAAGAEEDGAAEDGKDGNDEDGVACVAVAAAPSCACMEVAGPSCRGG